MVAAAPPNLPPTIGVVCPGCGSSDLGPHLDADRVNLRCRSCGVCWHIALGHVRRVEPAGCRTCAERAGWLAASAPLAGPVPS